MSSSSLQAAIITLLTSVVSVAVGFGAFNSGTEQILIAAIGPVVGSVVSIVIAIENHGKAVAGVK